MKRIGYSILFLIGAVSCSSPNITNIAEELCACKSLSPQEGELCFLRWEENYGTISLSESQKTTFDAIVVDCMGEKK